MVPTHISHRIFASGEVTRRVESFSPLKMLGVTLNREGLFGAADR